MMKSKMVFGFVVAFAMAVAPHVEGMEKRPLLKRGSYCLVPGKKLLITAAVLVVSGVAYYALSDVVQELFATKEAALEFLKANASEAVIELAGELASVVNASTLDSGKCFLSNMTKLTNIASASAFCALRNLIHTDFVCDHSGSCVPLQSDDTPITKNEWAVATYHAAEQYEEAENSCSRTPTDEQIDGCYEEIHFMGCDRFCKEGLVDRCMPYCSWVFHRFCCYGNKCYGVQLSVDTLALRQDQRIGDVDCGDTGLDYVQCEEGPSGDVACEFSCVPR